MSDNKSTLADIKSGKGLPPINTQSNTGSTSSGLTSEQRGQDSNGFRTDRFTLNNGNGGKGGK